MAQSVIWIMSDRMTMGGDGMRFNHAPPEKTRFQQLFGGCACSKSGPAFAGCNVLFLDGHVEYMRYIPIPGAGHHDARAGRKRPSRGPTSPSSATVAAVIRRRRADV